MANNPILMTSDRDAGDDLRIAVLRLADAGETAESIAATLKQPLETISVVLADLIHLKILRPVGEFQYTARREHSPRLRPPSEKKEARAVKVFRGGRK